MTIVTKGMGAIIKLISKGKDIQKRNEASKKMLKKSVIAHKKQATFLEKHAKSMQKVKGKK
jgi:hypothetical protein